MKLLGCILLFTVSVSSMAVQHGTIIFISRKLRMSALEPPTPRDFYVDLGEHQGIKLGDILQVYRIHPVLNGVTGDSSNFVRVLLGEMKIFLVGEYSSIGRVETMAKPVDLPILDYTSFMLGDVVDSKSSLPFDSPAP